MYQSARITCFLLISLLSVSLATAAVSYSGEQVIRVDVNNENRQKIHQLAQEINADVWTHSSSCNVIGYKSTGSSLDWAYYVQKIMFSFAVELRDQGVHHFQLPPDQIVPSGVETFAGLLGLAEYIINFYKKGRKSTNL